MDHPEVMRAVVRCTRVPAHLHSAIIVKLPEENVIGATQVLTAVAPVVRIGRAERDTESPFNVTRKLVSPDLKLASSPDRYGSI
jgi:hypothetical protein